MFCRVAVYHGVYAVISIQEFKMMTLVGRLLPQAGSKKSRLLDSFAIVDVEKNW